MIVYIAGKMTGLPDLGNGSRRFLYADNGQQIKRKTLAARN